MHIAAEFITAAGLIAAGLAVLHRSRWGTKAYLLFAGMLAYSAIVSPGYFAQQGQWGLVAMFMVLLLLTLAIVWILVQRTEGV
jgi:hypothetical protein